MRNRLTICYTDDDIVDLEIFKEVVIKIDENISVHLQQSGEELIEFLQSPGKKADLVFLDLKMPEKNGFDVLKDIQRIKNADLPPVIIFTVSGDEKHIKQSKQLGAKLFVEKPRHYETYVQTLKSIISENHV